MLIEMGYSKNMFQGKKYDYDLIVIGSGSGGSVGAHYAASLGKKVLLFEKGTIGGECPNFACVPTKALLKSAETYENLQEAHIFGINVKDVSFDYEHIWKRKNLVVSRTGAAHGEESFKNDGIHVIKAKAKFVSPNAVEANGKKYSASKFLIATGSSVFIPPITGLKETGFITFKEAVDLKKPPKSICIIGGGAVACEFAQIFSSFGTKVTMMVRSSLLSKEDLEVIELVEALFENRGISLLKSATVTRVKKKGNKKNVYYQYGDKEEAVETDEILLAAGKVPVLDLDLEKAEVKKNHSGLQVNTHLQTNISHIYGAGDVVGPFLFTHTGYYQGYIAAHNAFSNRKIRVNYDAVPRCVFTSPEVASVGLTEEEAKIKGVRTKKGLCPIAVLGRANTSEEFDGFVKVVVNEKNVIIGASIVAPRAGEMIHELVLAVQLKIKADVLADMIHAYPTYSEAIKIACSNIE